MFGVLLIGRIRFGWRGRTAVRLDPERIRRAGLAYFGAKFVLEDMLGRHGAERCADVAWHILPLGLLFGALWQAC